MSSFWVVILFLRTNRPLNKNNKNNINNINININNNIIIVNNNNNSIDDDNIDINNNINDTLLTVFSQSGSSSVKCNFDGHL